MALHVPTSSSSDGLYNLADANPQAVDPLPPTEDYAVAATPAASTPTPAAPPAPPGPATPPRQELPRTPADATAAAPCPCSCGGRRQGWRAAATA